MAVVSSILSIEVDELGRPLNIKAFDSGDTISSGILEEGVKTTLSSVNTSSIYWNETYYKVLDRSSIWEVGGEAQVPSDVSGKWQSAYNYLNSGGSATIGDVSSTVNVYSATWGAGGGAVPSDVSSKWQNAYDYLNNGASANIASTSATVSNASANWNSVYNRVLGTSGDWTSVYNRTLGSSGGWQNAFNYTSNASANITSTSAIILNGSSNWNSVYNRTLGSSGGWENAFVYLNTGASANVASTSATVSNASSNWNSVYNRVLGASGDWQNSYAFANSASANIISTSATVSNASANWNSVYNRTLGSSGGWQNAFNYAINSSATITSVSSSVFNTSSNWDSVYNRTLGSSGGWQNAFNYTSNASANIATVSSTVVNTSGNQRDASSLQGISIKTGTPANKDILLYNSTNTRWEGTNISNVIGSTSRNIADGFTLQGNNGIAITSVGSTNFIVVSGNTISQWDASALRGTALSSTLVPTNNQALVYSGTVWTASTINDVARSTNALSSTSALNTQQAPNGFNVTGTLAATTASATTYLNLPSSTLIWQQAEDIVLYVKNKSATSLPKGKAVTVVSGVGDTPIVEPLSSVNYHVPEAQGFANHVIGLVQDTIAGDSFGYLVVEGIIVGTGGDPLDTSLWNVGDGLYVSSNGQLNNIRPPAPYESHPVGFVIRKHATVGSILVKIENAAEINDIVGFNLASSLGNGDLISYDLTTSTFKNVQSVAVSGQGKFGSVSATTYLNLPSSTIVWASATSATNAFSATNALSSTSAFSATNAFSSTNALSATSALNASRAPAGFTVTGTLLATNISATNFSGIDHDTDILNVGTYTHAAIDAHITDTANPHSVTAEQVGNSTAQWNASALQDIGVKPSFPNDRDILMYSSPFNQWAAGSLLATDVGNTTAQWNASALRGTSLSSTLSPTTGQSLVYSGTVWIASSINSVTNATSATNAFSSTNAFSATNALSATSALNASRAPAGFNVTGTVAGVSATFSGTLSSTNLLTLSGDISATRLTDYSERVATFTITTSAITLNLNTAQVFSGTLNSNISSVTISNPDPRTNTAQGFTVLFMADGTARTITWPGAVKWASGTGPTMTSTNGKVDILSFFSPNNGTTWYGFVGGQNF